MLYPTSAIDIVKMRQSEIAREFCAYQVPKEVQAAHARPGVGIIPRVVHLVNSIRF
jgi:hypothetical protein